MELTTSPMIDKVKKMMVLVRLFSMVSLVMTLFIDTRRPEKASPSMTARVYLLGNMPE